MKNRNVGNKINFSSIYSTLRVSIPCIPGQFNEEHSFFAPGNQGDGLLYNGHLDETLFQVIRNRLGPNPNHNLNTLQNRKEAFYHLLDYCLDRNLKLEHWDVHFCQGSSNTYLRLIHYTFKANSYYEPFLMGFSYVVYVSLTQSYVSSHTWLLSSLMTDQHDMINTVPLQHAFRFPLFLPVATHWDILVC